MTYGHSLTRDPDLSRPRLDCECVAPGLEQPHLLAHHGLHLRHGLQSSLDLSSTMSQPIEASYTADIIMVNLVQRVPYLQNVKL